MKMRDQEIDMVLAHPKPAIAQPFVPWRSRVSEPERLRELERFLSGAFTTFREVGIEWQSPFGIVSGRIDLLAIPTVPGLDVAALAFEVKRDRFDVERALKQSADYVGGTILGGPHKGKRIAACFLYPCDDFDHADQGGGDRYQRGMFNLIAQWRVGRAFVKRGELWLALGFEIIWRRERGWVEGRAPDMLLGARSVGGSRRASAVNEASLRSLLGDAEFERLNGHRIQKRNLLGEADVATS
jgi:hypothetical protein